MKKKILIRLLFWGLIGAGLPVTMLADGGIRQVYAENMENVTIYVSNIGTDFGTGTNASPVYTMERALELLPDTGGTIEILDVAATEQLATDDPLCITKQVKIQGGELTLKRAGIVLGADVSFENITLNFTNNVRNALIANGHQLTLRNVKASDYGREIHAFVGAVTDSSTITKELPKTGECGRILIGGTNELGNIYAGNLSDVSDNSVVENQFRGSAEIVLEPRTKGVGNVYAHGAREPRGLGDADGMTADANAYTVAGEVQIHLTNGTTTVYGANGESSGAKVTFTDNGTGNQAAPLLYQIGALALSAGEGTMANFAPAAGSTFTENVEVSVPDGSRLDLTKLEAEVNFGSFTGGGTLILGENQRLTISGEVEETTKVAIKDIDFYGNSTGWIRENQVYIQAIHSKDHSFTLIPYAGEEQSFERGMDGSWMLATDLIKFGTISLENAVAEKTDTQKPMNVKATGKNGEEDFVYELPYMDRLIMKVNGTEAVYQEELYAYVHEETQLAMYFSEYEEGVCLVVIHQEEGSMLPEGEYQISITIPKEHSAVNQALVAEATLRVGALTPSPTEEVTPSPTEEVTPSPTEEPTETPEEKEVVTEIFSDVHKDWYTDYVQYVYDNGLMTGIKGTTQFQPNANITKAQVAQVLYNMEGQPASAGKAVFEKLGDVYAGEWYANAVAWAFDTGVVTGDLTTKKFNPNADVTREQLALMMYRYAEYKGCDISGTGDFSGLQNADQVAEWSYRGMSWAVGAGLISGVGNGDVKDLAPQGNATRAQMAAILQRFCEFTGKSV